MEVIPAIDVSGGRLARLESGRPVEVDAFGGDPMAAAQAFVAAGATRLHVVDVDLALAGEVSDLAFVSRIAGLGVRVQASGGVSTHVEVDAFLGAGADRVVLGSRALADRKSAERLITAFGQRLAVGIEVDGAVIRPRGSPGELEEGMDLFETLSWLVAAGAARFVVTQVPRVGTLSGPDRAMLASVIATAERTPVVVSGGLSSVADLAELAGMADGPEGAIVGRALYDGGMDLSRAIAVAG